MAGYKLNKYRELHVADHIQFENKRQVIAECFGQDKRCVNRNFKNINRFRVVFARYPLDDEDFGFGQQIEFILTEDDEKLIEYPSEKHLRHVFKHYIKTQRSYYLAEYVVFKLTANNRYEFAGLYVLDYNGDENFNIATVTFFRYARDIQLIGQPVENIKKIIPPRGLSKYTADFQVPAPYLRQGNENEPEKSLTSTIKTPKPRKSQFTFTKYGIGGGEIISYVGDPNITATVEDDKNVLFKGRPMSLTAFARELTGKENIGSTLSYFSYCGETLQERRDRIDAGKK